MSTHNIGFYEDLTKKILSIIIKYAPYLFFSDLGVLHKQCEEVCDPGKCGMSFLEDLAGVADSPYGRGVVEKLVRQDQKTRQGVCFSVLYLCR